MVARNVAEIVADHVQLTVEAIDRALASRPEPRDPADDRLVFLTRFGRPWVRFSDNGDVPEPLKQAVEKLLREARA